MKTFHFKILLLVLSAIFLFSCELLDEEKEIIIDANPFEPGVARVHVAVLEGDTVLAKKVYDQDDVNKDGSIEIYTTPGSNRTFVVVAEHEDGYASHFAHDTVDIDADGKAVVKLTMRDAIWDDTVANLAFSETGDTIYWGSTDIINTKYYIYDAYNAPYPLLYSGYDTVIEYDPVGAITYQIQLVVEFFPFGLKTEKSPVMTL